MKKEIIFLFAAIVFNIKSVLALRVSFVMSVIGMMLNNCAFIFVWVYLANAMGAVGGWNVWYVIGLQGLTSIVFGLVFSVFAGLRDMSRLVHGGNIDSFILSPKNTLLRIITSSFEASAVGDILYGVICLIVFGVALKISLLSVILLLVLIFFATVTFWSMILIAETFSFYVGPGSVLPRALGDVFFTPSLFHGGAFDGAMRFVFTFLIPSLVIGTLPIEAVANFDISKSVVVCVISCAWASVAVWFFALSLKRYEGGVGGYIG